MALVALVAMMLVEEEVVVSFMRHIPMVLKEHCIDAPPFPLPPTPAPSPVPLQSPPLLTCAPGWLRCRATCCRSGMTSSPSTLQTERRWGGHFRGGGEWRGACLDTLHASGGHTGTWAMDQGSGIRGHGKRMTVMGCFLLICPCGRADAGWAGRR